MKEKSDLELNEAHIIGCGRLNTYGEAIFPYNKRIYRTSAKNGKPQTKLICNVLVELIDIENKGSDEKPAHEYLFQVQGNHFDYIEKSYFKPNNLSSHRTFTTKLMGMVPFGEFCGTKEDFAQYYFSEVDKWQEKQKTKEKQRESESYE